MSDKGLELAVEAGVANLKQQDATFGNLRNRATAVLTVAVLVTSFTGSLGLVKKDGTPLWAAWTLFGVLVLIGVFVVAVQWPVAKWAFGLHPTLILERIAAGDDDDGLYGYLANELVTAMAANEKVINRRGRLYRIATMLLIIEVLVLTIAFVV